MANQNVSLQISLTTYDRPGRVDYHYVVRCESNGPQSAAHKQAVRHIAWQRLQMLNAGWEPLAGSQRPWNIVYSNGEMIISFLMTLKNEVSHDAYSWISDGNRINRTSIIRLDDGREVEVDRQNGFVITFFDNDNHKWGGVDLRNDGAEIVSLATF